MADKKNEELEVTTAKRAYLLGQRRSNYMEALAVGYTPIALIIGNFIVALTTAYYVAWLLPHIPHAEVKVGVFALMGSLAAMYLPSRLSFLTQTSAHKRRLPIYQKEAALKPAYVKWARKKMTGEISRNLALVAVSLFIMVFVHLTLIWMLTSAFTDSELMEKLGVEGGSKSSIVLGYGMEIVSIGIDLFLGLTTRLRVDVRNFFPDLDEIQELVLRHEEFEKMKKNITKANPQKDDKKKDPASSGGSSGGGGGGAAQALAKAKAMMGSKPIDPLPDLTEVTSTSEMFNRVLGTTTNFNPREFSRKLSQMSDSKRRGEVTQKLSKIGNKFRGLYKQASDTQTWNEDGDKIWGKLLETVAEATEIMGSIGMRVVGKRKGRKQKRN